jgi:hypothetical protein
MGLFRFMAGPSVLAGGGTAWLTTQTGSREQPCHGKLWNFLRTNGGLIVVLVISIASLAVNASLQVSTHAQIRVSRHV